MYSRFESSRRHRNVFIVSRAKSTEQLEIHMSLKKRPIFKLAYKIQRGKIKSFFLIFQPQEPICAREVWSDILRFQHFEISRTK